MKVLPVVSGGMDSVTMLHDLVCRGYEIDEMLKISNFDFEQYETHRPDDFKEDNVRTLALVMIKDKYDFICGALDAVIAQEELQPNDRSRALELIVADYTSGK